MTYQREFERRVRLGVVGVGFHCYRNILPVLTFLPVELVAVCDTDRARAVATATQYGVAHYGQTTDMYAQEQLDAVVLCVGAPQHPALATEAFAAGLHVWMEKPAALGTAGVQAMLEARSDRVCVVGFKKMFMPAARKLVEVIETHGGRGGLVSILASYPLSVPETRAQADADEGSWLSDGCHPLSLLVELGGPVDAVTVFRGARGGGACVLEFASGAVGNLHLAFGSPEAQPYEQYRAIGDGFYAEIDNITTVRYQRGIEFDYEYMTSFAPAGMDGGAIVWQPQSGLGTLENKAAFVQGFYGELRHFCDCVIEQRPATLGTLEQALSVVEVYEAAIASRATRVDLVRERSNEQ